MLARDQVRAAWADHRVCLSKEGAAQLMQLLGRLCLDGLPVPPSLHLVMWQRNAEPASIGVVCGQKGADRVVTARSHW